MVYGIFHRVGGGWVLKSTWAKRSDAERELVYLRDMCGLNVHLYVQAAVA